MAAILRLARFMRIPKGGNHFETCAICENPKRRTQQELTSCEQGGKRERSFLPRFVRFISEKGDFEKSISQNLSVRETVRPSGVQSQQGYNLSISPHQK